MQDGALNRLRTNAWISPADEPTWPAPAPVSRTEARNPAARRASANVSAAARVAGFVMTSISSPQGWTTIERLVTFLMKSAFSRAARTRFCGVSHGEPT